LTVYIAKPLSNSPDHSFKRIVVFDKQALSRSSLWMEDGG